MKQKIKLGAIIAVAALLSNTIIAQVTDTVKIIKETQIIHDTVAKKVIHDTVTKENIKPIKSALCRGEFGIRYMPTFASLSLRNYNGDIVQGEFTMSQGFGIMLAGNISKNIGLQAELSYLEISQQYKDQDLNRQVNVSYLNIPILLSVNTDKTRVVNLNFVGGPQFGVNLGSSAKTTGNTNSGTLQAVVAAKGTDIGVAFGTGLEIALTPSHSFRLDLGYRGFYGLVDASSSQYTNSPNTYNVLVRSSRMTQGAYVGLALCF